MFSLFPDPPCRKIDKGVVLSQIFITHGVSDQSWCQRPVMMLTDYDQLKSAKQPPSEPEKRFRKPRQ
jgi:hypothetical protein